jgi:hypothetical protein
VARSPSHQFGQIIGNVLEAAVEPMLRELAKTHNLYLDVKGTRKVRGKRKKITWLDLYGNSHDLDFVLERGGTDDKNGDPIAFIEAAWRRYTKHSKNKAQEIQGAIAPIVAKYSDCAPFAGVILAGEYTSEAIEQLKRLGFKLLHFNYDKVVKVFGKYGIDAASDEDTPDEEFAKKVGAWEKLSSSAQANLAADLAKSDGRAVQEFIQSLEKVILRFIVLVRILPLHGKAQELKSVKKAIEFISAYREDASATTFERYEIEIRYNNGDEINSKFRKKEDAIEFLKHYQEPFKPAPGK